MRYLIITLMFMAFFSCKKKTMIKVHVENVATGEPYVDQLIYIRENPQNVNQENSTVYEGYTDSEGKLFIDLKYRRNAKYFIFVSLPESYCYLHSLSYPINKEKTNDIHFRLAPCAQLKLKIENVNCEGAGDEMVLYQGNQIGSFDFNQPWEHDGCAFWESNGYSNVPMGEQYYRWEVTRSGTTEIFHDTIYLEEGEQRVYEILY
jgi:hypothetical protein